MTFARGVVLIIKKFPNVVWLDFYDQACLTTLCYHFESCSEITHWTDQIGKDKQRVIEMSRT